MRASFAQNAEILLRLLRALDAAAAWADDPAHHAVLAAHLARPEYLGVDADLIEEILGGRQRLGAHGEVNDPDFLCFHRRAANLPSAANGVWAYAQMVRWGQLAPSDHAQRLAAEVFRSDLYRRGLPDAKIEVPTFVQFDRTAFSAADVRGYLRQFPLNTPFTEFQTL
jgi:NitT/TauT family transport system ATP-binding protein